MRALIFVMLIIAYINANPQANQQAFQQGQSAANTFNNIVDQAQAPLQNFADTVRKSKENAEKIMAEANRLNPQTLEECEKVGFAHEFCFINFAKELKEYKEREECKVLAIFVARSLVDPYFSAGNGYEKKNCARFAPKPVKKDTK